MSMIEFRSVCKEYHGRQVIAALSLKTEAKERVVLFGPSGCGKSTILHLIAGFVVPDSGDILIDNRLVATSPMAVGAGSGGDHYYGDKGLAVLPLYMANLSVHLRGVYDCDESV